MSEDARLPGGRFAEWTNGTYDALEERDAAEECAETAAEDEAQETRRVFDEPLPDAAHASSVPPPPTPRIVPSAAALAASAASAASPEEAVDESQRPTNPGGEPEPPPRRTEPAQAPTHFALKENDSPAPRAERGSSSTGPMLISTGAPEPLEPDVPEDGSHPELFLADDSRPVSDALNARVASDAPSAIDVAAGAELDRWSPTAGAEFARKIPRLVVAGGLASLALAWAIVLFSPASTQGVHSEGAAPSPAAIQDTASVALLPAAAVISASSPARRGATDQAPPSVAPSAIPDAAVVAAPSKIGQAREALEAAPTRAVREPTRSATTPRVAATVDPHGEHKLKVEE